MLLVVAAALTNEAGEILLQKRPEGRSMAGLWEFPGGKIEPGEDPESALIREISEELGVVLSRTDIVPFAFASEPLDDLHLLLMLYRCTRWIGDPRPLESPELRWVKPGDMDQLPMPPADMPLVRAFRDIA